MEFALITGASKGIGLAIAKELAAKKINVLLVARNAVQLSNAANELKKQYGVEAFHFCADLTHQDSPKKIHEWCILHNYSVNILVNNAGYGISGVFDSHAVDEHIAMINVNMIAVLKLIALFLPSMRQQKKSYILNIGSSAAYQSVPYLSTYAASKAFIVSFSRALQYELRKTSVVVSVVSPGVTDTDFSITASVPEKGMKAAKKVSMTPEAVAAIAVKNLFSEKTETLTGFITKFTVFFVKLLPKKFSEKTAAGFYQ